MVHKNGGNPAEIQFQMIADRLDQKSGKFTDKKITCRCPGHQGKGTTSLSVELKGEKVLVHCFSGCKPEDILQAIGLDWNKVFGVEKKPEREWIPNPFPYLEKPTPTGNGAVFTYWDETGENELVRVKKTVLPNGEKTFVQSMKTKAGWVDSLKTLSRKVPPYLFHEVAKDKENPLVWVEGEKDVHTARERLGFLATTTIGGSGGFARTDETLVREMVRDRVVILIPDRDDAGTGYAEKVGDILEDAAGELIYLELPETVNGKPVKDLTDAANAGWTFEDLKKAALDARFSDSVLEAESLGSIHKMEPFPLEAFPPEIAAFIQATASTLMVDPAAVATLAMGIIAGSIGSKREIEVHTGWVHPCCLWMGVVMDSGQAKTAILRLVSGPVEKCHKERILDYRRRKAEYQSQMDVWDTISKGDRIPSEKPVPPVPLKQLILSDATIESVALTLKNNPDGSILVKDELSTWLGSFERYSAASTADYWLKFNDGTPETITRSKFPEPVYLENPLISIAGCIQPAVASNLLTTTAWSSGLVPRMHLCSPPRTQRFIRKPNGPIPGLAAYEAVIQWLIEELPRTNPMTLEEETIRVQMTDEAYEVFRESGNARYKRQKEASSNESSVLSKLVNLQARWSLCHHLLKAAIKRDGEASYKLVEADSAKAANLVADWFERESKRVFGLMVKTAAEQQDEEIFRYIGSCEFGTNAKDLRQKFRRRFPNCNEAEAFLKDNLKTHLFTEKVKLSRKRSVRFFLKKKT